MPKIAEKINKDKTKTPILKKGRFVEGVGRRKTSVARVRLFKAEGNDGGNIEINGRPFEKYFTLRNHQKTAKSPLTRLDLGNAFRATVKVVGGGVSSQADAVRHGIARALVKFDEEFRKKLKLFGFLTRDPRMVERKKFGLKKARRAPQWSKR
jgi:small subunit ribosomal protein S9